MKRIFLTLLMLAVLVAISGITAAPAIAAPRDGTPVEQSNTMLSLYALPMWVWLILAPFLLICAALFAAPLICSGQSDTQDSLR